MEKAKNFGGQAVIEGVMMRSPNYVVTAVRKKDGSINISQKHHKSLTAKIRILGWPFLRGAINLFEMIVIGTQALNFSAEQYAEDEENAENTQKNAKKQEEAAQNSPAQTPPVKNRLFETLAIGSSIIISIALALFLFKFLPLTFAEYVRDRIPSVAQNYLLFNVIDGLTRIVIFFSYICFLWLFKSFRRVFEYHGAEHMAVHTYENKKELTVENAKHFPALHPRCGTSFILIVLIASIIVYTFVPRNPVFWLNLAQRIAIIPLIAAVAYEILKFSAAHTENFFMRLIILPGLLTQKLTTQKPDANQIEVALAALKKAVELEGI